jgi:hypothetical protein
VKENPRHTKKKTKGVAYFDDLLYEENRYKVEQTNAWMDAFKGIIIRYEKRMITWWNMQWLCIIAIFLRKLKC